ncbi:MAG TPA: GYF domain-containing protein [Polyangia bacterium]|nr:GYF domain-containing protein [Polyangia bacterium]
MKIVCDSCGTKYSIADEKVRGKVFKIRCKKCSHIIVVRGGETGGPEATAAPAAEGGWHLVIDGEQVGPISDADVRTKIERGEIKGDTYTWKEGFADWVKLSAVPEFAALVTEEAAVAGGGELFNAGAAAAGSNGAERARRVSGAGQSLFGGGASDVFAAPAASGAKGGGGDLFGAAAAPAAETSSWPSSGAAAPGHDGGRVESLTGQRHENSVLFSLSNLQSLAMPAAKPAAASAGSAPVTEGSGLIDIRQMAASTLGTSPSNGGSPLGAIGGGPSPVDDLPAFGAFSPAAPVLLPLPSSSGPPKWVYLALVLGLVAVGGIAFMAFKVLTTKPPVLVEQVQQVPAPEQPKPAAAAAPAANANAKPSTIADENLPPREGSAEAKASEKGEHEHHHGGKGGHESKKAEEKKAGAAPAVAAAAPQPKSKDPLTALMDDADARHAGGGKARASNDDKPAPVAGPLSKSAVVAGMNGVKPKVAACYSQFKVPGMAMVNIVIARSGKVSSATVTGKFAGTPTGACVEKAVKSASFPPSEGLSTPYPFQLR